MDALFYRIKTAVLVSLFGLTITAAADVKDLKILLPGNKPSAYQFAVCYRPLDVRNLNVGHAFIAIGKWTGSSVEVTGYGFYPKNGWFGKVFGPGIVDFRPDDELVLKSSRFLFEDQPGATALPDGSCRILKHITPAKYEELQKLFATWNSKNYYLISNNCVTMVGDASKTAGLTTPEKRDGKHPETYVKELWILNGGLQIPPPP